MKSTRFLQLPFYFLLSFLALGFFACGDNLNGSGIDEFLPELPPKSGEAQSSFAGLITEGKQEELIAGPASSGVVGDYFIRNQSARFVIGAPGSMVGVVSSGGNLIDATALGSDGADLSPDQFGEASIIYQLGRHCSHDRMEVVRDGSAGGVAVLRAHGVTDYNKFVNIRGLGVLPIPDNLVPELPDSADCATTYVLEPDAKTLQIYFTIYNTGSTEITGPMGLLSDTGGEVFIFLPGIGFTRLGDISEAVDEANSHSPYMVWQGPKVAYGLIPRHEELNVPNGSIALLGVSIYVFGVEGFLDSFQSSKNRFFAIESGEGTSFAVDVFVGRDAAEVEAKYLSLHGQATAEMSGTVRWSDGTVAAGARVGVFEDTNANAALDEEDQIHSYVDCDADGNYQAHLKPGDYLLRAEIPAKARSVAMSLSTKAGNQSLDFSLEMPIAYDFRIVDDGNADALIPGRITVIGQRSIPWDQRVDGNFDNLGGVVATVLAKRGTSTDVGDGADEKLMLPPGQDYRVLVSRGTEWSVAELKLSPQAGDTPGELEFRLRRVVDTSDYISSEYHVHTLNSPDSPITVENRVATAVTDGIEFYASSDHDYVTNTQPIIESMGLEHLVRSIPGIEMSPLVYGHFNAWPIEHDASSPNGGAIDWPFGKDGYAMLPSEIFETAKSKGAELVQVNHARSGVSSNLDLTEHFDRLGLSFDYETRSYGGDVDSMPLPIDWLRLPPEETDLFSDDFNSLEVWNGFGMLDSNLDGVREITKMDIVMRDWFNFLSFGKAITPIGSSDTHYAVLEQMGMPRTMVRVSDDSENAVRSGAGLTRDVLDNLSRSGGALTDVIVTDGPHIRMRVGNNASPLGAVIDGSSGSIEIQIDVQSADWAKFDTIEFFANATPEVGDLDESFLKPFACFTTRNTLMAGDPCQSAGMGGAGTLNVNLVDVGNGFMRHESSKTFSVSVGDIPVRDGAHGTDAWIVARVRGDRAIYPLFVGNLLDGQDVSTFVNGPSPALEIILADNGRPASAFTSAFFVDFDGSGYKAPFAP